MGLDIVNLPVGRIKKDPMNLREDGDVDELVEEIKRVGFTNPIEVRPLQDGFYGAVSGSRRLAAAKKLGLETVPCIIREMDDLEALRRSMADNELHKPLTEAEKAAYYAKMVSLAGGVRAAARSLGIAKETIRGTLERHNLYNIIKLDEEGGAVPEDGQEQPRTVEEKPLQPERKSSVAQKKGKESSKKSSGLTKKDKIRAAKEALQKMGITKDYWKPDIVFNEEQKKAIQEQLFNLQSKVWEPKVFKRKPEAPALHEMLQKISILDAVPTDSWPIGWKPVAAKGAVKSLFPVYQLKGDFSTITVLLCPECGHVLRGLGKGLPVVCLECGFPNAENGWKKVDGRT
jgi:ParB/RepB/Spo0J family partition protein